MLHRLSGFRAYGWALKRGSNALKSVCPALAARVTRGTEACAPEILPYEIGNALSAMIKRDRLSLEQAFAAHEAFSRMTIRLLPSDIRSALKLSKKLGIYAYEAHLLSRKPVSIQVHSSRKRFNRELQESHDAKVCNRT